MATIGDDAESFSSMDDPKPPGSDFLILTKNLKLFYCYIFICDLTIIKVKIMVKVLISMSGW